MVKILLEIFEKYLVEPKIVFNFATADRIAEARSGLSGRVGRHNEKRLSALILDVSEFSQNSFRCQGLSNGRCPRICNFLAFGSVFREKYGRTLLLHIQAWASALLV